MQGKKGPEMTGWYFDCSGVCGFVFGGFGKGKTEVDMEMEDWFLSSRVDLVVRD